MDQYSKKKILSDDIRDLLNIKHIIKKEDSNFTNYQIDPVYWDQNEF